MSCRLGWGSELLSDWGEGLGELLLRWGRGCRASRRRGE